MFPKEKRKPFVQSLLPTNRRQPFNNSHDIHTHAHALRYAYDHDSLSEVSLAIHHHHRSRFTSPFFFCSYCFTSFFFLFLLNWTLSISDVIFQFTYPSSLVKRHYITLLNNNNNNNNNNLHITVTYRTYQSMELERFDV